MIVTGIRRFVSRLFARTFRRKGLLGLVFAVLTSDELIQFLRSGNVKKSDCIGSILHYEEVPELASWEQLQAHADESRES